MNQLATLRKPEHTFYSDLFTPKQNDLMNGIHEMGINYLDESYHKFPAEMHRDFFIMYRLNFLYNLGLPFNFCLETSRFMFSSLALIPLHEVTRHDMQILISVSIEND